jgi:ureidoacrylate peracid hydrolase
VASTLAGRPFLDPRYTALIVVDMQKGFCHPESRMEKSGVGTANQRAIVPNVIRLVRLVREHGIPVFWSRQVHFPEDVTRRRRRIPSHQAKQRWTPCLRGTWEVEFVDELVSEVLPEDHVVEKHRASAFFETNLDTKLRMLGIEQLVVAGCNTEFCVESTVRDGYFRDYDVVVVRDCVASPRPRFHEDTLAKVETYFGAVVSLDELPSVIIPVEGGGAAARPVLEEIRAEGEP